MTTVRAVIQDPYFEQPAWLSNVEYREFIYLSKLAFEDKDKMILPSCCCGLEMWRDVYEAVINKTGVWLGHDPFPTLEHTDDLVRIWSDDYSGVMRKDLSEKELENMFYIEYRRDELIKKLQCIETDLLDFFKHSLEKELMVVDEQLRKMMFLKYCNWFTGSKRCCKYE